MDDDHEILSVLGKSFEVLTKLLCMLDECDYSSISYRSRVLKYFDGVFTVHKHFFSADHEILYQGKSFSDALDVLRVDDNSIDLSVYNE